MDEDNNSNELASINTDYVAAAARAVLGEIPFVGSLLIELTGVIIPNQRVERIARFAEALATRLDTLEEDHIRAQLGDDSFTDLLEEGMRQASHALSDERRDYIASIIENSLSQEQIDYAESKHIMNLLDELNDIEIVWLRYHLHLTFGGDEEFRAEHHEILQPVMASFTDQQEVHDREAIQNSYLEHLSRLGLLETQYRTDFETSMPEFDSFTGAPEVQDYRLSSLGTMLLRFIGLSDTDQEA